MRKRKSENYSEFTWPWYEPGTWPVWTWYSSSYHTRCSISDMMEVTTAIMQCFRSSALIGNDGTVMNSSIHPQRGKSQGVKSEEFVGHVVIERSLSCLPTPPFSAQCHTLGEYWNKRSAKVCIKNFQTSSQNEVSIITIVFRDFISTPCVGVYIKRERERVSVLLLKHSIKILYKNQAGYTQFS